MIWLGSVISLFNMERSMAETNFSDASGALFAASADFIESQAQSPLHHKLTNKGEHHS